MPIFRRGLSKQIETDRIFHVGRVKICHVLNATPRDAVEKFICKIAVRINDCYAVSCLYVLQNQIAEQGRLARATFANGV
jgi:hypothetical protein